MSFAGVVAVLQTFQKFDNTQIAFGVIFLIVSLVLPLFLFYRIGVKIFNFFNLNKPEALEDKDSE